MKYSIRIGERIYQAEIADLDARPVVVMVDGQVIEVWPEMDSSQPVDSTAGALADNSPGKTLGMEGPKSHSAIPVSRALEKSLRAPIPGVILAVNVAIGDQVRPGQELFVIEAMKMRNVIRSNRAGIVDVLHVTPGQTVNHNDVLVEFKDQDEAR